MQETPLNEHQQLWRGYEAQVRRLCLNCPKKVCYNGCCDWFIQERKRLVKECKDARKKVKSLKP